MINLKFEAKFRGQGMKGDWKHFQWSITINGVSFEFNTGSGHATPYNKTFPNGSYAGRNKKPDNSLAVPSLELWLHVPTLDSVLECLLSDYEAGSMAFNDFCDNFGYSSDSLQALDIYRACMDNAPKLRKALGNEFEAVRKHIEEINA